ncbi:CHAT domain-containing protein [Nocardiopsis aegyptia]|uniref:CHAT domain-containing protein n=1 Tax=Nocardiopsis aegyptia TaxID=220378 RepID=UPI00366AFCDB
MPGSGQGEDGSVKVISEMRERLDAYARSDDRGCFAGPSAEALARRFTLHLSGRNLDIYDWHTAAWFLWHRGMVEPSSADQAGRIARQIFEQIAPHRPLLLPIEMLADPSVRKRSPFWKNPRGHAGELTATSSLQEALRTADELRDVSSRTGCLFHLRHCMEILSPERIGRAEHFTGDVQFRIGSAAGRAYHLTKDMNSLRVSTTAAAYALGALKNAPPGRYPDFAAALTLAGRGLYELACLDESVGEEDYEHCLNLLRHAVVHTPRDTPPRLERLLILHLCLHRDLERNNDAGRSQEAVIVLEEAAALVSDDQVPRVLTHLDSHAEICEELQRQDPNADFQADAVACRRLAVDILPADHPDLAERLLRLGRAQFELYRLDGYLGSFLAAQDTLDAAAARIPEGTPRRDEFDELNRLLMQAILSMTGGSALTPVLETEASETGTGGSGAPSTHRPYSAGLQHLVQRGLRLRERYEATDDPESLSASITTFREVLHRSRPGPERARAGFLLGSVLDGLHHLTGDTSVLSEQLRLARESVEGFPQDHPDLADSLGLLSWSLFQVYRTEHDKGALEEAARVGRRSIDLLDSGDARLAGALSALSAILQEVYLGQPDAATLSEAVDLARRAVALTADGPHPSTHMTLALALKKQSGREDVEEAVRVARRALSFLPPGHSSTSGVLSDLVGILARLHQITGDSEALREAVDAGHESLALAPTPSQFRLNALINLGMALMDLHEAHPDHDLLTEAERMAGEAESDARSVLDRARSLLVLGRSHLAQHEYTGDTDRLDQARAAFEQVTDLPGAPIDLRLEAGRRRVDVASALGRVDHALAQMEDVLSLVPLYLSRDLDRYERVAMLAPLEGVASQAAAAAAATGRLTHAVELLERARGLLLADTLFGHTEKTLLRERDPELADLFDDALAKLQHVDAASGMNVRVTATFTGEDGTVRERVVERPASVLHHPKDQRTRRRVDRAWRIVLDRVDSALGADSPLAAPDISRLRAQMPHGAVVIPYVSARRSEALVLPARPHDPVTSVPLPEATPARVDANAVRLRQALATVTDSDSDLDGLERAQQDLHAVFAWLWDAVTGPVLQHLGVGSALDGRPPRIWWSPLGPLVHLPLHAAGHHLGHGMTETVLDRTVSSYAPTLRSLARAAALPVRPQGQDMSALVVAVPELDGAVALPRALSEASLVRTFLPRGTSLTGPQATRGAVEDALADHPLVHFACHADLDSGPVQGGVHLHDDARYAYGLLRGVDLKGLPISHAELAYLSACSTMAGDRRLSDEHLHVAGAFHNAGFRQTVGTMWEVGDAAAERVARRFYAGITDEGAVAPRLGRAADALRRAVRDLRDDYPLTPSRWGAHLHVGVGPDEGREPTLQ